MQLSAIDLNLLLALDALLDTASVKDAARRLSLSPSAVSHTLARLRELFGDPLLVRSGQVLVRTARATRLQSQVRELIRAAEVLFAPEEVLDPARLERRFLLAATDHMAMLVIRRLSQLLASIAPGVELYTTAIGDDTFDKLRDGSLHLAMGAFPDQPPEIEADELFHDRYVCVLRRGHPALKSRLTLRRYASLSHILIAPRGVPVGRIDQELAKHNLTRHIARVVPSFHLAPHLVADTDYVVTMSARIAREYTERLDLVIIEPPLAIDPYPLKQIWHRKNTGEAALSWLREQISALAHALPPLS